MSRFQGSFISRVRDPTWWGIAISPEWLTWAPSDFTIILILVVLILEYRL